MLRIRTPQTAESVRASLAALVASGALAGGEVGADTFRLRPRARRRGVPVVLLGRILPDLDGTLVQVRVYPSWWMIAWFFIWAAFCRLVVRTPLWFIALGLTAGIADFLYEIWRSRNLLQRAMEQPPVS